MTSNWILKLGWSNSIGAGKENAPTNLSQVRLYIYIVTNVGHYEEMPFHVQ